MTNIPSIPAPQAAQGMQESKPDFNQQEFISRVRDSLRKVELQTIQIRKTNTSLSFGGMASAGIATLVAGLTSALGPLVGEGISGWRLACIVAALFSFIATIVAGLNQQLRLNDRLSENQKCLGRLSALEFSITSGSQNWAEITKEYSEILRSYPELLR
jgi:MFS family permease